MLKFFRRIRRKLLDEGRLRKYLVYAVGEILLVVIGIVIALQINNWNEARKLRDKEVEYLEGIKSDLLQDLELIKQSKALYTSRIMGYSKLGDKFERYVYKDWTYPLAKIPDTIQNISVSGLFGRPFAVRLHPGTYRSLSSSGESKVIQNQGLFNQFQNVYERRALSLESTYGTLKELEVELAKKHAKEIYNFPFERTEDIKDEDLLADLYLFMINIGRVYNVISILEQEILIAVREIEQELE